MLKKILFILFFISSWKISTAQQYINYNTKNGLPSNHVYRITQDKNGFVWFVTDKGLVKFDGTNFKTFTTKNGLPTNDIWDFRITDDNKFWYFTKASKLGYIYKDNIYAFESNLKNEILYPTIINQSKNNILFQNANKVYSLKEKKWKLQKLKNNSNYKEFIIHPTIKYILTSTLRDSLFFKNKDNKIIKSLKKPKEMNLSNHRTQINDSLFCWISNKGYTILNLNTLKIYSKTFKNQLSKGFVKFNRINNVNGEIQFSGENYVAKLDTNYNLTEVINIPEKFKSHFSFVDKNNNLWIATFNKGIYFLTEAKRKSNIQLANEKINKIKVVDNKLIATVYDKGFYIYNTNKNTFFPYIKENGFPFDATYIKAINTEFYLTNKKILAYKNKKTIKIKGFDNSYTPEILNDLARKIVYYDNYLFSYGSLGLFKLKPNLKPINQYIQNGIKDLLVINNRLIIATSSGLKTFKNDTIISVLDKQILNKPITALTKINNTQFVVSTDGFGAYITDLNTVATLEKSDFLDVQKAFVTNNKIFLPTNQGVWEYLKKENTYKLQKKYTINNGLSSNQIQSIYVKESKLFTGSNEGISIISLKDTLIEQFIKIYFNSISYNKKEILNSPEIKYTSNNQLDVKIATIDYSEVPKKTFQYKLEPIHKEWTSSSTKQILFNNLPPNKYILKIKSKDKIAKFNFKIIPIWYQTTWFQIISKLLFLLFFIGIILHFKQKNVTRQQKKLKAQKKLADFELHALRSQMNPHFVFNSLNAIQYYITKNEIDLSEKYLVKFSRLIRMFFDFSREKEISLSEEINLLKGYLEIEKMRFGDEFNYIFKIDTKLNIKEVIIPTMIIQPFVENAVNHGIFHNGGKGLIQIHFKYLNPKSYKIIISDNGVGIKKSKEIQKNSIHFNTKKNNSTNIIKDRIALLNQSQKWQVTYFVTNLQMGTSINLTFTKND